MRPVLTLLLLNPGVAVAAQAKASLQGFAAERKAGQTDEDSLSRLFSESTTSRRLEEPVAPVKAVHRAIPLPVAMSEMRRAEPAPPAPPAPVSEYDSTSAVSRQEMDKVSVLAALGYLKIGIMQGGAVAIYGFGSLGQVTSWGGPRQQLQSVLEQAVARGLLASAAAAVVDHSRYKPHR